MMALPVATESRLPTCLPWQKLPGSENRIRLTIQLEQ